MGRRLGEEDLEGVGVEVVLSLGAADVADEDWVGDGAVVAGWKVGREVGVVVGFGTVLGGEVEVERGENVPLGMEGLGR